MPLSNGFCYCSMVFFCTLRKEGERRDHREEEEARVEVDVVRGKEGKFDSGDDH